MCTLTLCRRLVYYVGIKFEPIWNSVLLPFWKSIQHSGLDHPQILSWCKKFSCFMFWLTSVKLSYSKSLSICIDFCLLQLHQLHDLMYDKSTDIKYFHFLQHPAMYACAKFVTSPAVVSKLTANSGTRISHFDDVSAISRESKSFLSIFIVKDTVTTDSHTWAMLVSVAIYWHLCQLTLHQSIISVMVRFYI